MISFVVLALLGIGFEESIIVLSVFWKNPGVKKISSKRIYLFHRFICAISHNYVYYYFGEPSMPKWQRKYHIDVMSG